MTSPRTLYAEYAGLTDAGRVAERQTDHLAGVGRYVADVCGRTEAFRGFLRPFAGTYGEAVDLAVDGVAAGGRAAGRWSAAARDTAEGLAEADAVVRRALAAVGARLPVAPRELPAADSTVPPPAPGLPPGSPAPAGLPSLGGSPVPLDDLTGLEPDLPGLLSPLDPRGPTEQHGPFGVALGQAGAVWSDGTAVVGAVRDIIDGGGGEAGDTGDDLERYADFVAGDER